VLGPDLNGADARSRLALAFDLLRGVLDPPGTRSAAPGVRAAHVPLHAVLQPPPDAAQLSATDLINVWFQPGGPVPDPWDDYFAQPAGSGSSARPDVGPGAPGPWDTLRALVTVSDDELADDQAEAAVQCLYEFVHAVGRRDVDSALELVAADYHTFENDREFDRLALRHQLESLLDSVEGWDLEASLATIPEPIPHHRGVVILAEIQIDASRAVDGARRSFVMRRVVVLDRRHGHEAWQITALSPI
jgi:hypothetical protein